MNNDIKQCLSKNADDYINVYEIIKTIKAAHMYCIISIQTEMCNRNTLVNGKMLLNILQLILCNNLVLHYFNLESNISLNFTLCIVDKIQQQFQFHHKSFACIVNSLQ